MRKPLLLTLCLLSPLTLQAAEEAPAIALQRGCDQGKADDCHDLGGLYAEGEEGVAKDLAKTALLFKRSYELYQQACTAGDGRSCWMAGMMVHQGEVPKDEPRMLALLRRSGDLRQVACDGGSADACFSLAGAYSHPDPGFVRDAARAGVLFEKACGMGMATACQSLGLAQERGDGMAGDKAKAFTTLKRAADLYRDACSKGDPEGCAELGYMYRDGQGLAREYADMVSYLLKACGVGYEEACWNLESVKSWAGPNGEGVDPRDAATLQKSCDAAVTADCIKLGLQLIDDDHKKEGMEAYDKACRGGDGLGCRLLAIQYEARAQALYVRAAPMLDQACTQGEPRACTALSAMAAAGEMQPVDRAAAKTYALQAAGLLEKACAAGQARACEGLATLLNDNQVSLAADPAKVVGLRQKACDGGFLDSCMRLGLDHYRPGVGVAADPVKAKALVKKACDGQVPSACELLSKMP